MLNIKRPPTETEPETLQGVFQDFPVMTRIEFDDLCAAANTGDETAIKKLRSIVVDHPRLCNDLSDLERLAETTVIQRITRGDVARTEALRQRVTDMKTELLGPDPPLALQLAAAPVCASWLEYEWAVARFGASDAETSDARKFASKYVEAALRRHRLALREFVKIQHLLATRPSTVSGQPNEDRRKKKFV